MPLNLPKSLYTLLYKEGYVPPHPRQKNLTKKKKRIVKRRLKASCKTQTAICYTLVYEEMLVYFKRVAMRVCLQTLSNDPGYAAGRICSTGPRGRHAAQTRARTYVCKKSARK